MLHAARDMKGFALLSSDGDAGTVKDFYFDDDKWTIRYLVVNTGGWLSGRLVLISPMSIIGADWTDETIKVDLTRQQIENSPDLDADKPVSRQHETEFFDYYGYPYYWAGPYLWGTSALPATAGGAMMTPATPAMAGAPRAEAAREEQTDEHLRSYAEVVGYDIQASNDSVGHVDDFLIDDRDWSIQMMVVDTRNWLPGKDVLISPRRIAKVDWLAKAVVVNATREEVEKSQEYNPALLKEESTLQELYRHSNDRTANQAGMERVGTEKIGTEKTVKVRKFRE
jgi:uncharacterized protein YrrD